MRIIFGFSLFCILCIAFVSAASAVIVKDHSGKDFGYSLQIKDTSRSGEAGPGIVDTPKRPDRLDASPPVSASSGSASLENTEDPPENISENLSQKKHITLDFTDSPDLTGSQNVSRTRADPRANQTARRAPVERIELNNVSSDVSIRIDDTLTSNVTPFRTSVKKIYAIDMGSSDFGNGTVTAIAKGTELYKCKEWRFDRKVCEGDWIKVMDITPGQNYSFEIFPGDPCYAERVSEFPAPRCATNESPCVASGALLKSRDGGLGVLEPDAPNNLDGCSDGASGGIYGPGQESVEKIIVTDLTHPEFSPGDKINISTWVYSYDYSAGDVVNIFYTSTPSSPAWTLVDSFPVSTSDLHEAGARYFLDDVVGYHAVRVMIDYAATPDMTCGSSGYQDQDDVVFWVGPPPPPPDPVTYVQGCTLIDSPGTYEMVSDAVGATIPALSGKACFAITSSDVSFDCKGFSVTDDGFGDTTYGFALVGPVTNVSIRNCPSVSGYSNGMSMLSSSQNYFAGFHAYDSRSDGIYMESSDNNNFKDCSVTHSASSGFTLLRSNHNQFEWVASTANLFNGLDADFSNSLSISGTFSTNALAGIDLMNSADASISSVTATDNHDGIIITNSKQAYIGDSDVSNNRKIGISLNPGSTSTTIKTNRVCHNIITDIENHGSDNFGLRDRCDTFLDWSEDGHAGCAKSCSDIWNRVYGYASGSRALRDDWNPESVYSWDGYAVRNVYLTDYDAVVDWQHLQAIGKKSDGINMAWNDFAELDEAFGTSSFPDSISATYSSSEVPLSTATFIVFGQPIYDVPVAPSAPGSSSSFRTGILWDMSDGDSEYSSYVRQTTVWVTKAEMGGVGPYGSCDYLAQIPYSLSSYEGGNDLVSVYLELE